MTKTETQKCGSVATTCFDILTRVQLLVLPNWKCYLNLQTRPQTIHSGSYALHFSTYIFDSLPKMPLTVPLYYSRGSEKYLEGLRGRGQAGPYMVPAGPCLLALTTGMLPPCSSLLAWPRQHAGLVSGPPATPCTASVWSTLSHPAPHHPPALSLCNATLTSALISMRCEKSHLLVQM